MVGLRWHTVVQCSASVLPIVLGSTLGLWALVIDPSRESGSSKDGRKFGGTFIFYVQSRRGSLYSRPRFEGQFMLWLDRQKFFSGVAEWKDSYLLVHLELWSSEKSSNESAYEASGTIRSLALCPSAIMHSYRTWDVQAMISPMPSLLCFEYAESSRLTINILFS